MELSVDVKKWTAWSTICDSKAKWQVWAENTCEVSEVVKAPKLSFVPPMTRRRFSPLTKVMFLCAHTILDNSHDQIQSVFCSRHGEQQTSQALLSSLAKDEPLSPLKFSVSVHNSASGMFSIFSKNQSASTAISGGHTSFFKGFFEAALKVNSGRADEVVYIYGDEPASELFSSVIDEPDYLYGVAFILTKPSSTPTLKLSHHTIDEFKSPTGSVALDVVRSFIIGTSSISYHSGKESWQLEADIPTLKNSFYEPHE